jgi:hypothetical protein
MKRTPLKKMGRDKARETAKYWPLRRKFIEDHPFCEFPVIYEHKFGSTVSCMTPVVSIHHMKGQNWRVMNDTRYWMGVCIEHHAWIEDNKREARKRGLILYK